MTRVTLQGHIQVPADDLDVVLRELDEHVRLTRAEPGCLAFEIRRSSEDDCRFEVYEVFSSRDAFDQHQVRTQRSRWGAVTVNVARHYDVAIDEASESGSGDVAGPVR